MVSPKHQRRPLPNGQRGNDPGAGGAKALHTKVVFSKVLQVLGSRWCHNYFGGDVVHSLRDLIRLVQFYEGACTADPVVLIV